MNLIIKINLDNEHFEDGLENCLEQIQWHLERHSRTNFNIAGSNGHTVGTVEVKE